MKILALSDSHGDAGTMEDLIKCINPDAVLFCGDGLDDILMLARLYPAVQFEYVRGNCDGGDAPLSKTVVLGGLTIMITHGHIYDTPDKMIEKARQNGAQLALHGHTHIPAVGRYGDITVVCPGSSKNRHPGRDQPSFALIQIDDDGFSCELLFAKNYITF